MTDLGDGQLPFGLFGANPAPRALMILAQNLSTKMKKLVPGADWVTKRFQARRFHLIGIPVRVVSYEQARSCAWGRVRRRWRRWLPPVGPFEQWHVDQQTPH